MGHYCRICGRTRANEKFTGKGHKNHICKDCTRESGRKPKEEYAEANPSIIEDYAILLSEDENLETEDYLYELELNEEDFPEISCEDNVGIEDDEIPF